MILCSVSVLFAGYFGRPVQKAAKICEGKFNLVIFTLVFKYFIFPFGSA